MGEPLGADEGRPLPIVSVPVSRAADHPEGPLVLRVANADEVRQVADVPPERVVWAETTASLAIGDWPPGIGLDILLTHPEQEAASLYDVARVRYERPLRVTIAAEAGVAKAARVAMALHLPVRLKMQQPAPAAIAELTPIVEAYLHDSQATEPVEPFHSALAHFVHGVPTTAWLALERDPAFHRTIGEDGLGDPHEPPPDVDFVGAHVSALVAAETECARCRFRAFCMGYFKWPDPTYDCGPVIELLGTLDAAATSILHDLDEAGPAPP